MIKSLLCAGFVLAASSASIYAASAYYPANTKDMMGMMTGISANGRFATAADEENNFAYLWNAENPTEYTCIGEKALAYAVTDDGLVTGAVFEGGKFRAAIYRDGEWIKLGDHDDVLNEQYANNVTADGKIIAGYEFCRDAEAEQGGRYYPVVWTLNEETGEYEITTFNDVELPDHQGFISQSLSPDGNLIGGRLYCGMMADVPAIFNVKDHSVMYWNKIEEKLEPWYYKGEIMGYATEYYIDGFHDTDSSNTFTGELLFCDTKGYFYGYRTVAYDVDENGEGKLHHYASVYNSNDNTWADYDQVGAFAMGYDAKTMFGTNASMLTVSEDGAVKVEDIRDGLDFSTSDEISAITHGSADGKTLGGIYGIFNPAKQAPDYYPFVIMLDEPLTGISDIMIDNSSDIAIIAAQGAIVVTGATNVAVYDLDGRLVSTSATSSVKAGVYVVKADNMSRKVLVK